MKGGRENEDQWRDHITPQTDQTVNAWEDEKCSYNENGLEKRMIRSISAKCTVEAAYGPIRAKTSILM
jgi:hypothetical protein